MIQKNDNNRKYGPLQIVHDFEFTALNLKDDYSILNTLNYNGKVDYIKSRIDRLERMGYSGIVMNVSYKEYLRDPEAFKLFFECAEYAKEKDLRVWIYDEQYYPSGSAGGLALADHPEFEALALACVTKDVTVNDYTEAIRIPSPYGYSDLKFASATPIVDGKLLNDKRINISGKKDLGGGLCFNAPRGKWRVYCFYLRPLYELTKFCSGTRASRRYINVFNKKAVEEFYRVTFENGYKAYYDEPLSNIVDAIFTDEPYCPFYAETIKLPSKTIQPSYSVYDEPDENIKIYPYIPWEMTLPERFTEKYGQSIEEYLPDIFFDTPTTIDARVKFYKLLSDMATDAFPKLMSEKLKKEGVLLSGHYFGEENFDYQPNFFGDIIEHLGIMGIPGCDSLWSEMERLRYSISCKLASSASHLASRENAMIEASNMVDVDQCITLKKAKAAISTMFVHGITLITSYYGESMLKEDEMCEFAKHISSLSQLLNGGKYRINTLLYYPFENLCADRSPMGITVGSYVAQDHLGIGTTAETLMKRQVCFDIINKKGLLSCEILDGFLMTSYGEKVKYIVFPNLPWIDGEVEEFLCKAKSKGVVILFNTDKTKISNLSFEHSVISDNLYPISNLSLEKYNPYVIVMQRAYKDMDIFMLMNTDDSPHSLDISINLNSSDRLFIINISTGKETDVDYKFKDGKAYINTEILALDHIIIGRRSNQEMHSQIQ